MLRFRRFDAISEGYDLHVKAAPAPSDIIWENLEEKSFSLMWRRVVVLICTLCLVSISFGLISKGQVKLFLYCILCVMNVMSKFRVILQRHSVHLTLLFIL